MLGKLSAVLVRSAMQAASAFLLPSDAWRTSDWQYNACMQLRQSWATAVSSPVTGAMNAGFVCLHRYCTGIREQRHGWRLHAMTQAGIFSSATVQLLDNKQLSSDGRSVPMHDAPPAGYQEEGDGSSFISAAQTVA